MISWRERVCLIVGILVLLCVLASMAGCVYRFATTDRDCWFATDPILCQKLKEVVK